MLLFQGFEFHGPTMFAVHVPGTFRQAHFDMKMLREAAPCKLTHVYPWVNTAGSTSPIRCLCNKGVQSFSFTTNLNSQLKIQYLSHQLTSKISLVSIIYLINPHVRMHKRERSVNCWLYWFLISACFCLVPI